MLQERHELFSEWPEYEGLVNRASGEIGHWLLLIMVLGEESAQVCNEFGMYIQIGLYEAPILEQEHVR